VDALASANALSLCGHDDWRLPNRRELFYFINRGQANTATWLNTLGFLNVSGTNFWAATTLAHLPGYANHPDMTIGFMGAYDKAGGPRLWATRTALATAPAISPRTGQTTCFDATGSVVACAGTGQDGDTLAGVPWPTPRFAVGIGAEADCVIDNVTGLMWVKTPEAMLRTWQQALDYANGLTLCGHSDWHLPNVIELEGLHNAEQANNVAWLNSQGFSNVQSIYYWSSTSSAPTPANAWQVLLHAGYVSNLNSKTTTAGAWPVRGP
jgi:hypothetical protein